jgi:[ribosomal protein S18]-alanine N-acetyltransferase
MSAALQAPEFAAPVRIRAMQDADIERVGAIEAAAYPFPWTTGIFRDCMRAGYGCWVLEQGGELIGYGVLSAAAGEAHVLNVCVHPDAQGRGHGRHLMQRLIDAARWYQAQRVFLEVRPTNAGAIALYESLGFARIGTRPNYYPATGGREDALVMGREISPGEA